jgi:nucleoid DNA-binding protein
MLNPKKIAVLYKSVAEELGIPESDLTDIVSFYWSQVRKSMESLDDANIFAESFGTFHVKPKALRAEMYKCEKYINSINPKDFSRYPYYKVAKEKLEKYEIMSKKILEENLRKKQKIDERYGNTTGSMEEKGENT